ncbi:MAG: hypothetical protein AABZ39_18365 [Spirochaetota bacterium]
MKKTILSAAVAMVFSIAATHAEPLIKNGGFEDDVSGKPPAGWVMWGPNDFKIPENYIADIANARTGKTSFRIHHPADTRGYVISDPQANAIRPKKAKKYTVTFWAKSDAAGTAVFRFGSYRSVNPYIDGPQINIPNGMFNVAPQWKQYSFAVSEGLEFFAESSAFIYISFTAASKPQEARTLWVDDIDVAESDAAAALSGMIDDDSLPYDPLPLRVTPGDTLRIAADLKKTLHRANRNVGGVSFHRVCGWTGHPYDKEGTYTLSSGSESGVADMRLPLTRVYAVGDEPFKLEDSIDKFAEVLGRVRIPQETTVLEFEDQGANRKLLPEDWVRGIRHSLSKGYAFKYWEIGNETYSSTFMSDRPHGQAFPTPDDYIRHFNAVSKAVKTAHPSGQIGISVNMNSRMWGNYLLKSTAGNYDFICPHWYGSIVDNNFEETVLGENHNKLSRILQVNALLAAYNKGKDVYQYDTEWGLHAGGPGGKPADYNSRNANIFGTVYRAVRLIYYTREKMLRGATSWQMFSRQAGPGFGVLFIPPDDEKRSMLYWLYYYVNRSVGDNVLEMKGTSPYVSLTKVRVPNSADASASVPMTPALITASDDGKRVFIITANGSWTKDVPCSITIGGFTAASSKSVLLTHGDIDGHPLLEKKEDFVKELAHTVNGGAVSFMLPAHSIAFIVLDAK